MAGKTPETGRVLEDPSRTDAHAIESGERGSTARPPGNSICVVESCGRSRVPRGDHRSSAEMTQPGDDRPGEQLVAEISRAGPAGNEDPGTVMGGERSARHSADATPAANVLGPWRALFNPDSRS